MKVVTTAIKNEVKVGEIKYRAVSNLDVARALSNLLYTVAQGSTPVDNADLLYVSLDLTEHIETALESVAKLSEGRIS